MPVATKMCDNFKDFAKLHEAQLIKSGVPKRYWDTLFVKLKNEVFNAGQHFSIMQVQTVDSDVEDEEEEEMSDWPDRNAWKVVVTSDTGIELDDPQHIYLIDHAWTYRAEEASSQLCALPDLQARMSAMMGIDTEDRSQEEVNQDILQEMWKYNQTYSISNGQQSGSEMSVWYIMDEFGSRVQHADTPSVRMVPFYYAQARQQYTIMWPVSNMKQGDEASRNYAEMYAGCDMLMHKVVMLPWFPDDMTHLSSEQFEQLDTFSQRCKENETLPRVDRDPPELSRDSNIRVYTDMELVKTHLTDCRFELVDNPDEADIWWTVKYLQDFRSFSEEHPNRFVSQFPCEAVLTSADLLAVLARRISNTKSKRLMRLEAEMGLEAESSSHMQTTYNLKTELPQFVSYFQQRDIKGLDNHWMIRPWNDYSSTDTCITDNLAYVLRLLETGDKIACKYVSDPVLLATPALGNVKFELRFLVLLYDVSPLRSAVYNQFIVNTTSKDFSLDSFDDQEKHFTDKNTANRNEVSCGEFVELFEGQYGGQYSEMKWTDLQGRVYTMLTEVLQGAIVEPPPKGIGTSPPSRAMYGVDVMFKWDKDDQGMRYMRPVLVEMSFMPDVQALCKGHDCASGGGGWANTGGTQVINDVFSSLFLDECDNITVL